MEEVRVFSVEEVAFVLVAARQALASPAPPPEGWSKSAVDPGAALAAFPALRLRAGWALRAYQYRKGENANAVVWAVPADLPFLEPAACPTLADLPFAPPRPPGALDRPLAALEGDGSPWSYLAASLLGRELADLGAAGRGMYWGAQALIGDQPAGAWQWLKARPAEWRPWVRLADGSADVCFHTANRGGRSVIYRHHDRYAPGVWVFQGHETAIAFAAPPAR